MRNEIPLGSVESHSCLLKQPPGNQKLYKIMTVSNLLKSISGGYLHFQRVDTYFDLFDGKQLPSDRVDNEESRFQSNPSFTAASYYDRCRARTYACCFSLENSDYIWSQYGNEDVRGKICLVFEFGKLRKTLNQTMDKSIKDSSLMLGRVKCRQIFSINYGIVEYMERDSYRLNSPYLPNPIQYTFLKDREKYCNEKEFRVSLSALGLGQFVLHDSAPIVLPQNIKFQFDFKIASANGVIEQILLSSHCNPEFPRYVQQELKRAGFSVTMG